MKVIEPRDAFLSDYEVVHFLKDLHKTHNWDKSSDARPYHHPELHAITAATINYLSLNKNNLNDEESQSTNTKEHESPICNLNDAQFTKLIAHLNNFPLYKAEKLQIANQLPTNMAHLYAIVEECDSRLSQDQIQEILTAMAAY